MNLLLERIAKKPDYTIGKLYIDGTYFCDTLEDTDRGLTTGMSSAEIAKRKVYAKTAIPTGRYKITLEYSLKFSPRHKGRNMPLLHNVMGFSGILIHEGNTVEDTSGCLLVGKNTVKGGLTESKATFERLWPLLDAAIKRGEKVMITVN